MGLEIRFVTGREQHFYREHCLQPRLKSHEQMCIETSPFSDRLCRGVGVRLSGEARVVEEWRLECFRVVGRGELAEKKDEQRATIESNSSSRDQGD
jgi:hypothetical protein